MTREEFQKAFAGYAGKIFDEVAIGLIYSHIQENNLGFIDDFNLICKLFKVEALSVFKSDEKYTDVIEYELDINPLDDDYNKILVSLVSEDLDVISSYEINNEEYLLYVRDDCPKAA